MDLQQFLIMGMYRIYVADSRNRIGNNILKWLGIVYQLVANPDILCDGMGILVNGQL